MPIRKILVYAILIPLSFTLAACKEKEGPAEKAGKELDKAAAAVGKQLENVGERIEGAVSNR